MTTKDARRTLLYDEERTLADCVPASRSEVGPRAGAAKRALGATVDNQPIVQPATYDALGFDIAAITPQDACQLILQYARDGRSKQVHLCNSYTLTLARRDPELARALNLSDLNLPDGVPVAWLGRKAGTTKSVRGPSLTADVFMAGIARDGRPGLRHYLYGGAPGVADAMADELRSQDSRIEIVGAESPPFRLPTDLEIAMLAQRIKAFGADIVWIGLGTPRQDYVVAALAPLVSATLVPVGAAFDFISKRVPEAPSVLHGTGFEWIYRLLQEPTRLWRRYLIDGARFACYLMEKPLTRMLKRKVTAIANVGARSKVV